MMRAYWAWRLRSEEAYYKALLRGQWPENVITPVSHRCEELRVNVALSTPLDWQDRVVLTGCALALVALGVILCL